MYHFIDCMIHHLCRRVFSYDHLCPLSESGYPYKVIDIVRVRQVFLALGIAFCGGLREGGREMEMVSLMADFAAAATKWDAEVSPKRVGLRFSLCHLETKLLDSSIRNDRKQRSCPPEFAQKVAFV